MRLRHGLLPALIVVSLGAATTGAAQEPGAIVRPDEGGAGSARGLGAGLFAANCATCHGVTGRGVAARGPSLLGVGARAADFYLRTGYMPLRSPTDQPTRSRVLFSEREIRALVSYVSALKPGPPIPHPQPQTGSLSEGLHQFTEHCAGCHQVATQGGVVTGARVPPLQNATVTQIAEAVRTGPYVMPRFPPSQISDRQLNSIVRYIAASRHPDDRGGWGIGNLGPAPEGIVTWLIAALALVSVCVLISSRSRR